jgi:Tol biopolymer transport system component
MGSMVYAHGRVAAAPRLVWVDREGQVTPFSEERARFKFPHLSPDGGRLALNDATLGWSIWVHDLEGRSRTPLVSQAMEPIWTPDGSSLTFCDMRHQEISKKSADGSGSAETLLSYENLRLPTSWSPDGRVLAFYEMNPTTKRDIWVHRLDGEGKPTPFLVTEFNEHSAMFSPDGRWLAYVSDESGEEEIYVRPYPGPGTKTMISTDGGREPVWSANGRELFYRNGGQVLSVRVETEPEFSAGAPSVLFEGDYYLEPGGGNCYDVTPDSQRFLMVQREPESPPTEITVVLNWIEELKRLVPNE